MVPVEYQRPKLEYFEQQNKVVLDYNSENKINESNLTSMNK